MLSQVPRSKIFVGLVFLGPMATILGVVKGKSKKRSYIRDPISKGDHSCIDIILNLPAGRTMMMMMNDIFIYAAYSITPKCILALYRFGLTICVTQLLHQMLCSHEQTKISRGVVFFQRTICGTSGRALV